MIGTTLGHYRVLEKIGAGGMGEVYRAHDERLERDVALKVLPAGTLAEEGARKRFRKEALALSKLNHPNIAAVYDFDTQDGVDFLVMEHIPGVTLSDKLGAQPLAEKELVRLGMQLAEGLAAAHERGVVHRDLKPGNLRVTPDGRLKILDFGLARVARPLSETARTESLTETQVAAGTLPYMAPEQLRGEQVDPRSDIYAVGVVLYEMATGRRPFAEKDRARLGAAIVEKALQAPSEINRRLSSGLENIILKALEKDPEHRYQSAKELSVDLRRLTMPPVATPRREPRRTIWWVVRLVPAGLLLVALIAGLWLLQLPRRPPSAARELTERQLGVYSFPSVAYTGALSPDGKYFAYGQVIQGEERISLQVVESGEVRVLDLPPWFHTRQIGWFVDSSKLLLVGERKGQKPSIWAVSLFGGTPRLLHEGGEWPSVSPDGSLIVFKKDGEIWVMGANGEDPRRPIPVGEGNELGPPSWSPNGERIVFQSRRRGPEGSKTAFEAAKLAGSEATVIWSKGLRWEDSPPHWLPDGRIIYSQQINLWQIKVDPDTGRAVGTPEQITRWSSMDLNGLGDVGVTRDGKRIGIFKWQARQDVLVGELEANWRRLTDVRVLPLGERFPGPTGWTADSQKLFFNSQRRGNPDIFRQSIEQGMAEPFLAGPENEGDARLSPDRSWVLYVSWRPGEPRRLMRIPASGGTAELVLTASTAGLSFRCSYQPPGNCVVAEKKKSQVVFSTFDAIKGEKREIARIPPEWEWPLEEWDLSPDGTALVVHMKEDVLQVLDLSGKMLREVPTPDSGRGPVAWVPNQKGFFFVWYGKAGCTLVHLDIEGRKRLLWGGGYIIRDLVPSLDGKRLAWTNQVTQVTCSLLENF